MPSDAAAFCAEVASDSEMRAASLSIARESETGRILMPEVSEREGTAQDRFAAGLGEKDCVCFAGQGEIALQATQRNERGAHHALLRTQRKIAQLFGRQNFPHCQADGAGGIVFAAVEPLGGDRGRLLQTDHKRITRMRADLGREGGAQQHVARLRGFAFAVVKFPEAVIDAVDRNGRGLTAAIGRDNAFHRDQRNCRGKRIGQRFAKETGAGDDRIGRAEAAQKQIAKAGSHRFAD